ncbi:MAG TPA: class I SAM-dependent methyltransferase [Dehalococcoidia bacterium]|nr:class I SAM-dependent methyltransferase [Dehalococcoidia bacterium]
MISEREKTQFELPRGLLGRITFIFMNRGHKSIYENVAKVSELKPEDDLLEVACGNGHFLKKYASHVHSIAGLDLSELSVELATKRNKDRIAAGTAEIVQGDASQLPWEDDKFSVTTAMASFMMFPEPLESLKEMYRVLRTGGRVVICIEWNAEDGKDHSKDIKKYGMQLWTEGDVREMMKNAGFSDVSINYARGMMMPKMMLARGIKS